MPSEYLHKYGIVLTQQVPDFQLELICFAQNLTADRGGLGRYRHFMNASRLIFPQMIRHEWFERQIKSLCDDELAVKSGSSVRRFIRWAGCGSSAKTYDSGHYGFLWWLADPKNSIVILTSTTKDMIRHRVWPVFQEHFHAARQNIAEKLKIDVSRVGAGHLVDSKTTIQAEKGDDKHSIFAVAVKDGETSKAVARIQGQHAPRILLIVDEATDVPDAILKTVPNLEKGCQDLTVLLIGNPRSRMIDPFGKACEPVNGWNSVTKDSDQWQAKAVKELCLESGPCIHFQGSKSPNVKAGKTIYPFLYSYENHLEAKSENRIGTLQYWMWDEGFPPTESVSNTIFNETMVDAFNLRGTLVFLGDVLILSALDPAFGGDRCTQKFAKFGELTNGKMGIQFYKTVHIPIKADAKEPVDYQIAHQAMENCKTEMCLPGHLGIKPAHFSLDGTGTGRGVAAIMQTEWSAEIKKVEFGGSPSDRPASATDPRPSKEVYDRKVTELWYSVREFAVAGQIGGLNSDDILQFCTREYEIRSRKYRIDTKQEVKAKLGRSPDDADTCAIIVDLARTLGAAANTGFAEKVDESWEKHASEVNSVYDDIDYSSQELVEVGEFDETE